MKGIAHFASGLCLASFIPGVVEAAAGGSLLIALGGACAMLPDTLDFRLARFLERHDADIAPSRDDLDAQRIADALAEQVWLAERDGRPRTVQLHPLRLSAAEWATYAVEFDTARGEVVATLDRDGLPRRARAGPMRYDYDGPLRVDELGGPSLKLAPGGGRVAIEFLPWHRLWSHSLVLAAALGAAAAILLEPAAGLAAAAGFTVHILEDQLGYMGSNLFAPFSRRRTDGLKLLHSGDPIPNLVTVWVSLALLLLNLDRAQPAPLLAQGPYLGFGAALPAVALCGLYAWRRWRAHAARLETLRERDVALEAEEVQT
jgi:hypothetical protein